MEEIYQLLYDIDELIMMPIVRDPDNTIQYSHIILSNRIAKFLKSLTNQSICFMNHHQKVSGALIDLAQMPNNLQPLYHYLFTALNRFCSSEESIAKIGQRAIRLQDNLMQKTTNIILKQLIHPSLIYIVRHDIEQIDCQSTWILLCQLHNINHNQFWKLEVSDRAKLHQYPLTPLKHFALFRGNLLQQCIEIINPHFTTHALLIVFDMPDANLLMK